MTAPDTQSAHIRMVSLSWDSATVVYCLPAMTEVSATLLAPEERPLATSGEVGTVGRLELTGLTPDTPHRIAVEWEEGSQEIAFHTLPAPEGERLLAFGAIADPHISLARFNRKGRLFIESRTILRWVLDDCKAAGVEFAVIAGDVTNMAANDEYEAAAAILSDAAFPVFPAPGDHDLKKGSPAQEQWAKLFGPTQSYRRVGPLGIFTLDTANVALGREGIELLEAHWDDAPGPRILCAHHGFVRNSYHVTGAKRQDISDFDDHAETLERLFQDPTLIYAGHHNVPATMRIGNAMQVTLPQTLQYPCGYLLVEMYANGFYHRFRPIQSEILNQHSRTETNLSGHYFNADGWQSDYRIGKSVSASNFLYSTNGERA
jgi:Calcineurin-like phosphoesterase